MTDILAWGEALIDFAQTGSDEAGFPALQALPGGAPANFLAACAVQGLRTELIASVGHDAFGELLKSALPTRGVGTGHFQTAADRFTTLAFVTNTPDGDRSFSFARKPGADTALELTDSVRDALCRCRVFHFGTLSMTDPACAEATLTAATLARGNGAFITCDPNLRRPLWNSERDARSAMMHAVRRADAVKLSEEEGRFLFGTGPEETLHCLRDLGTRLAFVTLGAEGAIGFAGTDRVRHPGFSVNAVDTTGAGDVFFGTAIGWMVSRSLLPEELSAGDLQEMTKTACAAAALSTTRRGGFFSVPSAEETEHFLQTHT